MFHVFKNVGKDLQLKTIAMLVFFLCLVKSENFLDNMLVDPMKKCGLLADFHYGFRPPQLTADFLTVVPDRIARAFNRSELTQAIALDISKAFDRVGHAGLLHKL